MKWFSARTNPAAIYLPQFITEEEERLLYRSLVSAPKKTDNRGKASGAVDTNEPKNNFVRLDQEETLALLLSDADGGSRLVREIRKSQSAVTGENPNRLRKWEGEYAEYSENKWNSWWKRTAKLPTNRRREVAARFIKSNVSKRTYANKVKSNPIGNNGRDANNQWARRSKWNDEHPYDFQRVVPILRRIDRAFKLALPERYAIQREYVSRIHPDFRIADTVFTTVTVNANFQTALHRDEGNLRQGFSNLLVLCNGRRYEGGHFILPEFGAEVALKPRDLIFVQNDEYLHSNTEIVHRDADATRMSLVCYVRESFLFSGTPTYENLRRDFVKFQKNLPESKRIRERQWESESWYAYLRQHLGARGSDSLIDVARSNNVLTAELLYLCAKYESDPLFQMDKYQYVGELAPPPQAEQIGLAAVFSALHLKTARQDQVVEKGKKRESSDDGALLVDSIFIDEVEGERWCIGYTTSDSGAARFNNNRFNVQALAPIKSLPRELNRLSRDAYEWIQTHWKEGRSVWLVSVPTGIAEAPYRMALTSVSPSDRKNPETTSRLKRSRQDFYENASSIAGRSFPSTPGHTALLYDLGWRRVNQTEGQLRTNTSAVRCEAIEPTYDSERAYLSEHLAHYVRRVRALNSDQYRERYSLIGTYRSLSKPIPIAKLHTPWAWDVSRKALSLCQGEDEYVLSCNQPVKTWRTSALSALIFGTRIPNASVRVWVHKNPVGAKTGQVTATDGGNFWLFQSTSRVGYIGADEVHHYAINGGTKIIRKPVVIRHAQHQNPISPLNKGLIKRVRKIPNTRASAIPTTVRSRLEAIENFQIAIPSYGRSGMIADFTLKMLERYKVDPKRVTIFVADAVTERLWVEEKIRGKSVPDDVGRYEFATRDDGSRKRKVWVRRSNERELKSDAVLYRERLKDNPYGRRIVVGEVGIGPQRNFIQQYYPEGTHLLSMDDDLTGLFELILDANKTKNNIMRDEGVDVNGRKFHKVVRDAFSMCHERGSHIFGFYASSERNQSIAVRRTTVETKPCYIIASMYGKIVRHSADLEVKMLNHAEDQERTLRFLAKDGITLRFNRCSVNKGTSYLSLGGIQEARKHASSTARKGEPRFENEIKSLASEFAQYCSATVPHKKDTWELRWKGKSVDDKISR